MDQFKDIPLLESLLNFQKKHVIFATYLQNVTTLPCKMANNVRVHMVFCKSWGQILCDKHVHRIVNCIEQLTNKIHLSGNLVSFLTVEFL